MKPAPFAYHAPTTIDETVGLLAELGDDGRVLAGGQSLIPMLAIRLASFPHLVDIGRVEELRGIEASDGTVSVGAGTRAATIGRDATVAELVPLLHRATPLIGHFQIRNRGTIGGSLAHADPAAEFPAVAVALDAELEIASVDARRRVAAGAFFQGLWTTALDTGDLLVAAHFPTWSGRRGFAVREFARRHGDFAVAGAVVGIALDAEGAIDRCAVAAFGVGSAPVRLTDLEVAAVGRTPQGVDVRSLAAGALADIDDVISDVHGSAAYRRRVGAHMIAMAFDAAAEEAAGA